MDFVRDHVPETHPDKQPLIALLQQSFPSNEFNVWGVPAGASSIIRSLDVGDYMLLVESVHFPDGYIPALCPVKVFIKSEFPELSFALWQSSHYPFVFFFNTISLDLSWFEFLEHVGYKDNFNPRGKVYRIAEKRLARFGGYGGYIHHLQRNHSKNCGS